MPELVPFYRFVTRLSGGFILAFHEVSPDRFIELIDSIRPSEPVSLDALVARNRQSKPTSGLFAITIDDGVGENVRSLAATLSARGWPATFYLPTDYLSSGLGLPFQWWRKVAPLLPHEVLALRSGALDLSRPGALRQFSHKMQLSWYTERLESYFPLLMELVDAVAARTGIDRAALAPPAPITWTEVERLSRNDLLRFESHGVSHAAMSALRKDELEFEMRHSRDTISDHTGRPCRHLTYPFGSPPSIGGLAPVVARAFYDSATTMSLGHVDGANPWLLPRIPLYPRNSTAFARLKVFLKRKSPLSS